MTRARCGSAALGGQSALRSTSRGWRRNSAIRTPCLFLAQVSGDPVGQVRLQRAGDSGEVHIAVAPASRGKGYAQAMIRALQGDPALLRGLRRLTAKVHVANRVSLRLFAARGFIATDVVGDFVQLEWLATSQLTD